MGHNEAIRKLGHLLEPEAEHAREAAIELEALVSLPRVRTLGSWHSYR